MFGKRLPVYAKYLIIETLLKLGDTIDGDTVDECWNNVMSKTGSSSPEALMTDACKRHDCGVNSLLRHAIYCICKIRPMRAENEWFDNFRLNGICSGFGLVQWHDNGRDDIYSVERDHLPIVDIDGPYERWCRVIINPFRSFIISNDLYPSDGYVIKRSFIELDPKTICDRCYERYAFNFIGAHGSNFYDYTDIAPTLSELHQFCLRYPSSIVGAVLNFDPYGNYGTHWVSMTWRHKNCFLISSDGRSFEGFTDRSMLQRMREAGFVPSYNMRSIQHDRSSCGMFASLQLYLMLCNDCDITKTVDMIGSQCTSLSPGKDIMSFIRKLAVG